MCAKIYRIVRIPWSLIVFDRGSHGLDQVVIAQILCAVTDFRQNQNGSGLDSLIDQGLALIKNSALRIRNSVSLRGRTADNCVICDTIFGANSASATFVGTDMSTVLSPMRMLTGIRAGGLDAVVLAMRFLCSIVLP